MSLGERRFSALDTARGIAIVLVATFHMSRALIKAHKLDYAVWIDFLDRFAYGFHVQIFFLISGYFVYGRVRWDAALLRRVVNLYYPYLIYCLASGLLLLALAGTANHGITPREIALIPIWPIQHYWFIPFLIVALALLAVVRNRVESALALVLGLALAAYAYWPQVRWGPYQLGGLSYWLTFFLAGCVIRKHGLLPRASPLWFAIALAASLLTVWYSLRTGIYTREPRFFPVSLAMCYALYCISSWIDARWLAKLGAASLVVYLTHVIFGSAARIVAYRVWPQAPVWLVFPFILAVAVIAPLVYFETAARLGLARLLGLRPILAEPPRPGIIDADSRSA